MLMSGRYTFSVVVLPGASMKTMTRKRLLVSVVDDDESVRESLPDLLRQFGFSARVFPSAEAFLASEGVAQTSCLILDIAMPGMSGPELQLELQTSSTRCRSCSSPPAGIGAFARNFW